MGPSIGSVGGLLLLWNAAFWQKIDEHVGRVSIAVLLKDVKRGSAWVTTSVYGPHNPTDRADFWLELNQVAGMWNRPWVLGGDFNVIRFLHEKKGGGSMSKAMKNFSNGFAGMILLIYL